jgi:predicted regulator of Ras-like GTPase activity (Roadblock/LC7/MglB family)
MSQEINTILKQLNSTDGIKASLIATPDGMPVTQLKTSVFKGEELAAISSSIYLAIKKSIEKLDLRDMTRYVLCGSLGKIFIICLGKMILIVLTENDIALAKVNVAIFQAANSIRKSGRLDI